MEFSGISLVTGAAGFMGSHVVEYLVGQGVKVRATARPRDDISFFERLGVEFRPADLTRPDTIPLLFEGVDRVFHLGAICNFSTAFEKLYPTNVQGVQQITEIARQQKVKCFVHVASTSVYGYYQGTPFAETDARNPRDSYGKSKKAGEDIVFERIKDGFPAVIVRPCTVYGPRCRDGAGKVFSRPSAISAIPGSGQQRLSNIRAEDVAAAVFFLSERPDLYGEAFNIAEDTHPSLEEALKLAAGAYRTKVPGLRLPLKIVKLSARLDGWISGMKGKIPDLEADAVNYLYSDYIVDNRKLKQAGFRLQYPDFNESLRELGTRYWDEHKKNRSIRRSIDSEKREDGMGQTVVITGLAQGMGKEVALMLAKAGDAIAGFDVDRAGIEALQKELDDLNARHLLMAVDITDRDEIKRFRDEVLDTFGHVDTVLSNVGIGFFGPFEEIDLESALKCLEINVIGAAAIFQGFLPSMRAQGKGKLIAMSSLVGKIPFPFESMYTASKFAIEGLMESIKYEVEPFGIRVATIQPAQVSTNFAAKIHHLPPEGSPYRERARRFIDRDNELIKTATTPGVAAQRIVKVLKSAKPKLHNQVDFMSTFFLFLNRILPKGIRDSILLNHMDIKV